MMNSKSKQEPLAVIVDLPRSPCSVTQLSILTSVAFVVAVASRPVPQ